MASREEILANFQACTGIENVELAISQLEDAGWSFVDAVNKVIPGSDPSAPPTPIDISSSPEIISPLSSNRHSFVSLADDFVPGTSSTRLLEFDVQHGEKMIHLKVHDNESILTLKTLLHKETGFPACKQDLHGFRGVSHSFMSRDSTKLSELNLPKQNVLHLITPDPSPPSTSESTSSSMAENESNGESNNFKLTIEDQTNDKVYNLNFSPTLSVLSVKLGTSNVTNIPVSKQVWTGWPEDVNDDLSLAQLGIPQEHYLTLKRLEPKLPSTSSEGTSSTNPEPRSMPEIDANMSDVDSDEEYEDAPEMEDEYFFSNNEGSSSTSKGRICPLIPDDYGDESLAGVKFAEEFAIRESCMQPAKDRKMLAVYLHHDSSVLTNVFCTQALCAESIVQFLNANFISFGWDLTNISNRVRATEMITREFGSVASLTVRNLDVERFPILALVYRLRGTTEIFKMIHGKVTLDELMSELLSAHETYTAQLRIEVREDEERAERDAVKREQDLAFEMSLQADREKQAQREREEEERKEQELLEEALRKSEEEARLLEEREKGKKRQLIEGRLPDEPTPDSKDASRLRIHYLFTKGYSEEEFKVLTSFPRRDLTSIDSSKTHQFFYKNINWIEGNRYGLIDVRVTVIHHQPSLNDRIFE
ncbi:FAF1 [Lepeophtheirus salmonis]|uniref:FAF1 n=1 Tax=Lepeophtheirus salmonis TaxID=72036 RepID=A0A7R8CUL5_LEPSM|nr:FAF1 [Lepeophtheirus salmonis]CAF2901204.1 FAF1 [Lepeophtheirus salmonis]